MFIERLKFGKNNNTCDSMKQKLTLSVDGNLIKLAKMNHINLSQLLTNILEGQDRVSHPPCASMSSNRNHKSQIELYMRKINDSDVTENQKKFKIRWINKYVQFCEGNESLERTLDFLHEVKKYDNTTYCKVFFCLRNYLAFMEYDFIGKLDVPRPKYYSPKRLTDEELNACLNHFKTDQQIQCILKTGSFSGCRAYELYASEFTDYDLPNRTLSINRLNGKSTKNLSSIRLCYYTKEVANMLNDYFNYCKEIKRKKPFDMQQVNDKMKKYNLFHVKDCRHVFIRNASLRGMPEIAIRKIIGHNRPQRNNILDQHYAYIDEKTELKQIYNKFFPSED